MKLTTTLTLLFLLFNFNLAVAQDSTFSKHDFNFYVDDVKKSINNVEISIIIAGDTIKANKVGNFFYFPLIDTTKNFDLEVKANNITFLGQGYKAWILNRGTRIVLGKLTILKKLLSVAAYNGMTKNDEGWEWYSKRFFVLDHAYTLDIDNRDKIKELQFLIINPNNSNSLVTTQKIIK
ncbi:hypothetical protein I5907_00025 [Panacibacter sp. DH6]|uniref:Uncharacterized protein n=1 Tax=Panacibacter microcysteis TaxID=2793269 RepID=A0A931E555_9BACT|nr:hypothetical protein [Panacibacter microcysteis]MBG9374604.1 hypothetical protein [Panacibacter microcysteis]